MIKFLIGAIVINIFSVTMLFSAGFDSQNQKQVKGNYSSQADSLRKEHFRPRHADTVRESPTDRMPVLKTDSNNNDPRMPVAEPKPQEHMPVKELSDTTKHK